MQIELTEQDVQVLLGALNTAPATGFQAMQLALNLGARLTKAMLPQPQAVAKAPAAQPIGRDKKA